MGETLAIPPAATGDLLVITTHSGEQKFTGIREMRISKQNLAYEAPKVHKIPINLFMGIFVPPGVRA